MQPPPFSFSEEDEYYDDYDYDYYNSGPCDGLKSIMGGWYGVEGRYRGNTWEHRENPCFPAYYNYDNFVKRNVMASDLGIIAKTGKDQSAFFVVTDLRTANRSPERA